MGGTAGQGASPAAGKYIGPEKQHPARTDPPAFMHRLESEAKVLPLAVFALRKPYPNPFRVPEHWTPDLDSRARDRP